MTQILQVVGALLLLSGFVTAQLGAARDSTVPYLAVNSAGAACLAVIAFLGRDWGFLLLEGAWAGISLAGLVREAHCVPRSSPSQPLLPETIGRAATNDVSGSAEPVRPVAHQARPAPMPTTAQYPHRAHRWRQLLPPQRVASFAGDELSQHGRLIHLFRDSYAGAQGRQWLQPHILWWILIVLRHNGVRADFTTLDSPELAHTVTTLGLPAGHTDVHPTDQTSMNFHLWWPILTGLARAAYRPWWLRRWPCRGYRLPDAKQIEDRAWRVGLRPWMSSASFEEVSGIARALACIHDHDRRRGQADADDFMVRILLPELLTVELHWLHAAGGRPRTGNRARVDLVLLRRYDNALARWTHGHYLTPLDHMYLRAGDILQHLASLPEESANPLLRRIIDLYNELRRAQDPNSPPPVSPNVVEPRPTTAHSDMHRPEESEKTTMDT